MKILMVTPSLSKKWGGTTTSLLNFYSGLTKNKSIDCNIVAIVTDEEQGNIDDDVFLNSDFILFNKKTSCWKYSKHLNNYLLENVRSYDLIWIHTLWTGTTFYAAKYAIKYNIPYIVTPHGMIEANALKRKATKKKLYWSLIEKNIFNRASAIHCITKAESLSVKALINTNTFVVPNGVKKQSYLNKDYNDEKCICFIGRFHEIKALDLLLNAISQIDDLRLLVAGGGEKKYERYIYSLVNKLKINDRVEFKGFADHDLKKWIFKQSAFLVLPSYTEASSMVGLESIMYSTPVLTTSKCNFDEIEQYNAGMVMENNHPATIKKYILKMFDSDIEKMSINSHKLAIDKYSINSVSQMILKELDKIV
jgi:glycosyltransferase involved in cell wall biosynthesis